MSSQDQAADRFSIERLLASLEEAWARGDAAAYASQALEVRLANRPTR